MLAVNGVKMYKNYISRDFNGRSGSACAYHSSCSAYVKTVLKDEGLGGALKGLARLQKCTPGNNSLRIAKFLKYTANCPTEQLEQFFHFSDDSVREQFNEFRTQLLGAAYQLATKEDARGVASYDKAITSFLSEVHFTIADPARADSKPVLFRLSPRRKPKDLVKADRGPVANTIRAGAALVGAGVGALVGGIAGLVTGAALGAADGFSAGLGLDQVRQQQKQKKYGAGTDGGNKETREKATRLYQTLQKRLGLEVVSNLVGGTYGLVRGFISGGYNTASSVGRMGREMGSVLGRNVSDELLGKLVKGDGEFVVAKAHHHHNHAEHTHEHERKPSDVQAKAQHLWSVLSQAPPEFQTESQSSESKQSWQLAVFSDATPNDLEGQELRRVLEFERGLPTNSKARIHVRRDGLISPKFRSLLRAGKFVASAASLVALSGGGIALSLVPSLLLRGLSLATGVSTLKEAFRDHRSHNEEFWNGRKVYSLDGPSKEISDKIQSEPVDVHGAASAVSSEKLSHDLQHSFSGSGPRVAVFAGHANSYNKLAGYEPGVLAEALTDCSTKTGQKTDLLIFDACKTATLEALAPLADGANYALVSQLPVGKVGLPWHSILKDLKSFEGSAQELAQSIVEKYGGLEAVPTLSVVDLSKLSDLKIELEKLAPMLSEEQRATMLDQDDISQVRDEGIFKRMQRRFASLLPGSRSNDLSKMLESVDQTDLDPSTRKQLEKVKATLADSVVSQKSPGLGGLSVEAPSVFFHESAYAEKTGLKNWGSLLAEEQNILGKAVAPLGTLQRKVSTSLREGQRRLIFGRPE